MGSAAPLQVLMVAVVVVIVVAVTLVCVVTTQLPQYAGHFVRRALPITALSHLDLSAADGQSVGSSLPLHVPRVVVVLVRVAVVTVVCVVVVVEVVQVLQSAGHLPLTTVPKTWFEQSIRLKSVQRIGSASPLHVGTGASVAGASVAGGRVAGASVACGRVAGGSVVLPSSSSAGPVGLIAPRVVPSSSVVVVDSAMVVVAATCTYDSSASSEGFPNSSPIEFNPRHINAGSSLT
jgi:hypothetical protein